MSDRELYQYRQIQQAVEEFQGPDAYVIATIRKVSNLPVSHRPRKVHRVKSFTDIVKLLDNLSLNRL